MDTLVAKVDGELDHSALIRLLAEMAGM